MINREKSTGLLYLLAAILIMASMAHAELANEQEMENVCNNWLDYYVSLNGSWDKFVDPRISSVVEITDGSQLLARCYNIDPIGFVVVPVLKELPPVKAYSYECNLDLDAPEGVGALLKDVIKNRIDEYVNHYGSADAIQANKSEQMFDPSHRTTWDRFAVSSEEFARTMAVKADDPQVEVGPLLETTWHQGGPYNNYCPIGDNGRCVVGCVATAAAQVQWYHKWPPAGLRGKTYLWDGDDSCNGQTPPMFLGANFSDTYSYEWSVHNLAEINHEMGVAFSMMYGACASGAYTSGCRGIYANYYGYKNIVEENFRSDHFQGEWFQIIKDDIDAGLPLLYTISRHAIVADGYQIFDGDNYFYHMNYGWGGSQNAWYAMDKLHCTWEGCTFTIERCYSQIIPDREIMFYADTISGHVPLEIQFTAMSERDVTSWEWDFGDGTTSTEQNPVHTFNKSGCFDVSLTITHDQGTRTMTRDDFIFAIDDTLTANVVKADPGETIEITIEATNSEPLSQIIIPVEYGGDLNMVFDSFSTAGCRTSHFEKQNLKHEDLYYKRFTLSLQARLAAYSWTQNLEPGSGPVAKLYFTTSGSAPEGASSDIVLDGYSTYAPTFFGDIFTTIYSYNASCTDGLARIDLICGDANDDEECNLLDILFMIDAVYNQGDQPVPVSSGDVNIDESLDLLDILELIEFIYQEGSILDCMN